jgi:hypothetical protein
MKQIRSAVACLAMLVCAWVQPGYGQTVTTGSIAGTVVDQQGGVLPGVSVTAVHVPTGTSYETVTAGDGGFTIPNVRVGGPYTVTATLAGFRDGQLSDVQVGLGDARQVKFTLPVAAVTETVQVTAETPLINTERAGAGSSVSQQAVESLPTINRSMFDLVRTSPYVNPTSQGSDLNISIAGRNNRYNNIQIDGAVNNDVFGLSATGSPGGQTGSQPISLDAIQELKVEVSPYDVRQGGFSGGAVNAITRSGANTLSGTGYYYGRNESLVGEIPAIATVANPNPADVKVGPFKDRQVGFSLGGPIKRNKAFFFGNADWARKDTPTGFSGNGSSGQTISSASNFQQVVDISKSKYGYDPGSLDQFSKPNNANKVFVRADINLRPGSQLTIRHNYVDSLARINFPSSTIYYMPTAFYQFTDTTNSTVGQLNSAFKLAVNEFRFAYQRVRDNRGDADGQAHFPFVEVDFPDNTNVRFGSENSSHANELHQDVIELTDDYTMIKGKHTITVGTHNEFYKFYNLFIQNLYGNYRFSSIANYQAGLAQSYSLNYSNTSNPLEAAQFSVHQYGFYGGDQWRASSVFSVTYGLRVDIPRFPDTPHANPLALSEFGIPTDHVPAPTMWSPRAGFNWDLSGGSSNRAQLRGGGGVFTGRTPYVWLSNQYGNTGIDFTNLAVNFNANNKIAFSPDPLNQPRTVTGGATGRQTINLIDPDYSYPTLLRGNIAYDHQIPWGMVGSVEFVGSKNIKDILYQNLNYIPNGTLPDGRLTYTKKDPNLNDVVLLTNTSKGSNYTTTFRVERPFAKGFYFSGSYLYNRATTINDGGSSVARSNWAFGSYVNYDVNNPPLALSNYSNGHRITLTGIVPIPLSHSIRSMASLYYNGQTGQPYTIVFNGDANADGVTTNDVMYVPASADQVNVINGTFDQLMNFINNDCSTSGAKGTIPLRNNCTSPWLNQLDFRYAVTLPSGGRSKVELSMDIINMLNLFNKNWGWNMYPNLSSPIPIGYSGLTGGKETFNLSTINSPTYLGTFTRDDLRSRWQMQFGARFRF